MRVEPYGVVWCVVVCGLSMRVYDFMRALHMHACNHVCVHARTHVGVHVRFACNACMHAWIAFKQA